MVLGFSCSVHMMQLLGGRWRVGCRPNMCWRMKGVMPLTSTGRLMSKSTEVPSPISPAPSLNCLQAAELRALLSRTVGWQFDGVEVLGEDSDDEYAPVVVEGVEV